MTEFNELSFFQKSEDNLKIETKTKTTSILTQKTMTTLADPQMTYQVTFKKPNKTIFFNQIKMSQPNQKKKFQPNQNLNQIKMSQPSKNFF